MTKDENIKTIRFPVKTDEKLQTIANKCGLTKLDLFIYMVDYFYKTKKDPRDLNDELLKNAINKKTDNIVAFVKTQEQELLIPIKKEGERTNHTLKQLTELIHQKVISHNQKQSEDYQVQAINIQKIAEYLNRLDTAQLEKSKLRKRFSDILESYIRQREQLGMMSSKADKDELIRKVREQLTEL